MALATSLVVLFYCCATADILTKLLQQCFLFFIIVVIPGHSQVSVVLLWSLDPAQILQCSGVLRCVNSGHWSTLHTVMKFSGKQCRPSSLNEDLGSKNKDADQPCSYSSADLCLFCMRVRILHGHNKTMYQTKG